MAPEPPGDKPASDGHEDCATCNGYIFVQKLGKFVKTRSTVDLVCMTCGHDYRKD